MSRPLTGTGEQLEVVAQLASGAGHEINNPLGFMVTNLKVLREQLADTEQPPDPGEVLELIDECLCGAQRIADIVAGLRELAKQERSAPVPTEVNSGIERAVRHVLGDAHHVSLKLEAQAQVTVVPQQLEQVVANLVKNARQASAEDAGIVVRSWDADGHVHIEVKDKGCGISPMNLPHVYEPFFTTRRVGEGSGLGLTSAWGIMKRHGGDIAIESKGGVGTTVRLRFPIGWKPEALVAEEAVSFAARKENAAQGHSQ